MRALRFAPTVLVFVVGITTLGLATRGITAFAEDAPTEPQWTKLETAPAKGKQDDICFVDTQTGWYVNGTGRIFKTTNGGTSWKEQLHKDGTFFRCVGFVDSQHGYAGNVGPDYFPGVSDTNLLYETKDGGETWTTVWGVEGSGAKGLCALDILKVPFINSGVLDYKVHVFAGGRVGGPAFLFHLKDGAKKWETIDLSKQCGMILDVEFFDPENGVVCAASDSNVEKSNALVLRTADGGKTWENVYQSKRPFELTWKCSFPTRDVGYVTVQSYDPDPKATQRYVAKTTDGGKTWSEIPLADDKKCHEFGVAFATPEHGWVGGMQTSYETKDGGKTWATVDMGKAVNKIRLLKDGDGLVGYAIGLSVYKLTK